MWARNWDWDGHRGRHRMQGCMYVGVGVRVWMWV